ncbi:hypothetical protein OEZ85_005167 [Tetradesmus obliquus]|uniref:Uncharacterized protein n=1 Tax=Tetradesmus obliquus TaxID=3088 RepID=A0ABY8UKB0_TETOB|nr:hypothetical protein OEZ85_005167 [Tetradesmus obliquus]
MASTPEVALVALVPVLLALLASPSAAAVIVRTQAPIASPRHRLLLQGLAAQVEGTGNDIEIHDGSPQGRSAGAAASLAAAAIQTNYIAAPHTADAPFASNVPAHITIYERCNYQGRAAHGYVGPFPSLPAEIL